MAIFGPFSALGDQLPCTPRFSLAAEHIRRCFTEGSEDRTRVLGLAAGITQRIELADGVFALEEAYFTKPRSEGRWESHHLFIDVQVMIEGDEIMDLLDTAELTVHEDLSPARDIVFYQPIDGGTALRFTKGTAAVFFPADGHRPGLMADAPAFVRKVVVKIPVT